MSSSYDGVVEIKETSVDHANDLLKEGNWKLLEIKTLSCRVFKDNVVVKRGITENKYRDVYDEYEKMSTFLGGLKTLNKLSYLASFVCAARQMSPAFCLCKIYFSRP